MQPSAKWAGATTESTMPEEKAVTATEVYTLAKELLAEQVDDPAGQITVTQAGAILRKMVSIP